MTSWLHRRSFTWLGYVYQCLCSVLALTFGVRMNAAHLLTLLCHLCHASEVAVCTLYPEEPPCLPGALAILMLAYAQPSSPVSGGALRPRASQSGGCPSCTTDGFSGSLAVLDCRSSLVRVVHTRHLSCPTNGISSSLAELSCRSELARIARFLFEIGLGSAHDPHCEQQCEF